MLRRSLITAITFAALAPSSALADELCTSMQGMTPPMQGTPRQAMSVMQAMSSASLSRAPLSLPRVEAPGPTWTQLRESLEVGPLFSSDGTMLVSSGELDEFFRAREVEDRERVPFSEILWCWSGDDPRCSPRTPPHDAPYSLQTGHRGIPVELFDRWPALQDGDRSPRGALLGGPREGVRGRVERPPRG